MGKRKKSKEEENDQIEELEVEEESATVKEIDMSAQNEDLKEAYGVAKDDYILTNLTPIQRSKIIGALKHLGMFKRDDKKLSDQDLYEKLQSINPQAITDDRKKNNLGSLINADTASMTKLQVVDKLKKMCG